MADTIWLQRPSGDVPWGFRISGGRDYQEPVKVSRVTGGSIASTGLANGDVLLRIGDADTSCLTQAQANDLIKNSGNLLQLCVSKGSNVQSPAVGTPPTGGQFPTRLQEQLSSMTINSHPGSQPATPYSPYSSPGQVKTPTYTPSQPTNTPYSPYTPTMRGYQSPGVQPQQQNYRSPNTAPGGPNYHPLANVAPPPPAPPPPMENNYSPVSYGSRSDKQLPHVAPKPMPDAVLNMAAKGQPDKKPFAYAADMNEIKEHREKVRRKPVGIPSYQNILNLPQFDEKPITRPYNPAAPNQPAPQIPSQYQQGPGEGVYKHAQYNSPMGLYSSDTAEEAFVGQTEGLVTNVKGKEDKMPQIRLPGTKETCDITQSETYKMIHGMDAPKERPKLVIPAHSYQGRPTREPAPDDEMTFSGVIRPSDIPSKSFHRLQSMTDNNETGGGGGPGGSEVDTTSLRHMHHLGDELEGVSGYDEASIRYLGKNIPSKSFRMLQSMTGGADQPVQAMPKRRPVRRREEPQPHQVEEKHDDEIVDISYVGGNIPSRSFKMLQQSIGEPHDESSQQEEEGSAVRVQQVRHEPPTPEIQHQQKQELPPTHPTYESPTGTGDRRQRRRQRNREIHDNPPHEKQFDESAYLSGQVQIVSDSVNKPPRPRTQLSIDLSHSSQPKEEEEEEKKKDFDEQAFLTGKLPIVTGEAKPWSPKRKQFREKAPWERDEHEGRPTELFQEEPFRKKGPVEREKAPWERTDEQPSGREKLASINYRKEVQKEKAPWEKESVGHSPKQDFDENAFLKRRPSAPIEQHDDEPPVSNGLPFDETSFLQGRVSGSESDSQDLHPSTQYKKPTAFRERAPWEKSEVELEQENFDEKEFLMGRVPLVNSNERRSSQGKGRFNKVPSKTFLRLTRSMSRETSPSLDTTSDYLSADDDDRSDPGLSTTDPRYVGHKIPSKTFLKLHRSMERRSAEPERDNYFYDDHQRPNFDDYVSKQVEDVTIEKKDPEVYLNNLKETMQETRVEPQAEATDF